MKILVLAQNYSRPNGFISLEYIHSRNKVYVKSGIDVDVVSFSAKEDYIIDEIKVYTIETYYKMLKYNKYDILLLHAPNIKNHYRFLKINGKNFKNIIFFFHGHEVLKKSKIYPKPYSFQKSQSLIYRTVNDIYDEIKLRVWKRYLIKNSSKSSFVFVSNWMYEKFLEFVKIDPTFISNKKYIIHNCVGESFEKNHYKEDIPKKYDFITIRNNLDGSKYAIDVVNNIAKNNPKYKFCVIGKGEFFSHYEKANNIIWIDKNLTHKEILYYLNQSKCALLPSRVDSQGVMACEFATFGIPLITSELDVSKEVFEGFENVGFIDNNDKKVNVELIYRKLIKNNNKGINNRYTAENTIEKEIELFWQVVSN